MKRSSLRYFALAATSAIALQLPMVARADSASSGVAVLTAPAADNESVTIAGNGSAAAIAFDPNDYEVVSVAVGLFADDVARVTGQRPAVVHAPGDSRQLIIAGTLGKSALIKQLADADKLRELDRIRGHWEATLTQIVDNPFPGVDRALVVVGSDRRGTAYGLMQLSRKIGVSPWVWWADVPPQTHDHLAVHVSHPSVDEPAVRYRGFFINDEDWGLNPWASKTFDPKFGNIGPKTYAKVFELMLRLRLNYIWPAMHDCSTEFAAAPENAALADRYGIVAGSSHCEPMLCNNIHWDEKTQGPWNYSLNRDTIHAYWEDSAKTRGGDEAVWTLGIRGIHDRSMESPPSDVPGRIKLVEQVIKDQRELLAEHVGDEWGPVAQCFVPYKEVLPLYDAGLKVPDDVTIVWVDDNFGYIRRLGAPAERERSGGAGVYWHTSYYGGPHSYTWIDTTAPALMWEELHKAWENDARRIWMINVGDIKPMEIGIDYFSRFSWNPDGFPLAAQRAFLRDFAAANFGEALADRTAALLVDFYRLGTIRKPELMERRWALSLTPERAAQLDAGYRNLIDREQALASEVPADAQDAYTELVGFPVHVLGDTGRIFLADRNVQLGHEIDSNNATIAALKGDLENRVAHYNTAIAGGKWNHMMPGLVTGENLMSWNSQVRWPWGEPEEKAEPPAPAPREANWRDAASFDRQVAGGPARWSPVEGLGPSGRAVALLPAALASSWSEGDNTAPTLEFDFKSGSNPPEALVDFLPTFRIYPGMKLRVAVSVDDQKPVIVEVPGSSGDENENGQIRSQGVQDNYVRARVPLPALSAGEHTFRIRAIDPGTVIDRLWLP